MKTTTIILCLLMIGTFSCFAEPDKKETIKIGVITPLTGVLAASGISVKNSIQLADQIYDTENLVEFSFEDDALQPKNSVSIARKFIAEHKDAIIIFGTPTSMAVAPITEQAKVPLLTITILDKVVKDRSFAFRHFVSWQEENRLVIEQAKVKGYKRIAIVASANDATLALKDGFINQSGLQVVLAEDFIRDDFDFRSLITKVKANKPDAIYNLLFSPQASVFMKSLRESGSKVPVFAVHNVEDPSEIKAAGKAFEGIWYVTGDDSAGTFYRESYQKQYSVLPAMGGSNAFDYAKMIIEAAQKNTPLLDYIKTLKNFSGAFGEYSIAADNSFQLKATVRVLDSLRIFHP